MGKEIKRKDRQRLCLQYLQKLFWKKVLQKTSIFLMKIKKTA